MLINYAFWSLVPCVLWFADITWSIGTDYITLKGAGSRNRKQTCYLKNLYCCPHVAIVFCPDFGGWGESKLKLPLQIYQYLCNRTTYERFVCFSTKYKSPSSKYHFHFEKSSGKSLWSGLSKILQNCRFEKILFTLRDPAPLKLGLTFSKWPKLAGVLVHSTI